MLDQNTDRMWYVIGAVLIGAAIIFGMNTLMPNAFASVGDMFMNVLPETNLIENPSFNDGMSGWRDGIHFTNNSEILAPEDDKPDKSILRVHMNHDVEYMAPFHNGNRISAKKGDIYTVSFDYRKHSDDDFPALTLRAWIHSGTRANGDSGILDFHDNLDFTPRANSTVYNDQFDGAIGEWKRYSFTAIAKEDADVVLAPYFARQGNSYDIRDIRMVKELSR